MLIGFILRSIIHAFKLANTILNCLINFPFNNMAPVIAGIYNVFFRYSNINKKKRLHCWTTIVIFVNKLHETV